MTCNLVFNMLYKLSLDSVQRCPYLTYSAMQKYLDLLTFFVVLLSYDAIYALINAPFSDFLLSQNTFLSICLFVCFLSEVYKTVALCLFLSQTLARVPSQQSHLRSPKCCLAWRNWRSFHWWMKPMPRPQQAISPAPRRLLRNGAGSCLNVALRTSLSKVKKKQTSQSLWAGIITHTETESYENMSDLSWVKKDVGNLCTGLWMYCTLCCRGPSVRSRSLQCIWCDGPLRHWGEDGYVQVQWLNRLSNRQWLQHWCLWWQPSEWCHQPRLRCQWTLRLRWPGDILRNALYANVEWLKKCIPPLDLFCAGSKKRHQISFNPTQATDFEFSFT